MYDFQFELKSAADELLKREKDKDSIEYSVAKLQFNSVLQKYVDTLIYNGIRESFKAGTHSYKNSKGITFEVVSEYAFEFLKVSDIKKAKKDGRYKDAKINFVNSLKKYVDSKIIEEIEKDFGMP